MKEIKYLIQQGKQGYPERDLWDPCNYLCDIIPSILRDLAKKSHGCPSELWDKKAKNNECHRWIEIIEEIAQGFEAAKAIENSIGCNFKKELEDGAFKYEYDKKLAKQMTEKFEKGMNLFKKYFLYLWD